MKAVRLHAYGDPSQLVYEDVPDPVPGDGEVVVEVAAVSVNPMDFKFRSGAFQAFVPFTMPAIFGWDVAGTIGAVGPGVTGFKPGDRVVAYLNVMKGGGYAEKVAVPAAMLTRVPEGLALENAATLPCAGLTAQQAIEKHLKPRPGQRVLVTGALGAVGRFTVQLARQAGAEVIAGVRGRQREEAKELGVAGVVATDDAADVARHGPYESVIDTTGGGVGEGLLGHIQKGGLLVTVGPPPAAPADGSVRVELVQVQPDPEGLGRLAAGMARGDLTLPIRARLPLSEAAEAHRRLEAGGVGGKIVLVP